MSDCIAVENQNHATAVPLWAISHEMSAAAFHLYAVLLSYAQSNAWPGWENIANDMGVSVRSVHRYNAELKQHGIVSYGYHNGKRHLVISFAQPGGAQ